eukprot:1022956-Pyramimonas_sp.AAC.1
MFEVKWCQPPTIVVVQRGSSAEAWVRSRNTVLHHLFMEHNLNRLRFSGALLNTLEQMVTAGGANLNKKNRRGEITWKA